MRTSTEHAGALADAAALDSDAEPRQLYWPSLLFWMVRPASLLGRKLGHRVASRTACTFMVSVGHVYGRFPTIYAHAEDSTEEVTPVGDHARQAVPHVGLSPATVDMHLSPSPSMRTSHTWVGSGRWCRWPGRAVSYEVTSVQGGCCTLLLHRHLALAVMRRRRQPEVLPARQLLT